MNCLEHRPQQRRCRLRRKWRQTTTKVTTKRPTFRRQNRRMWFNLNVQAGDNFTNILLEPFSYESIFCSFSALAVWLCNFLSKKEIGTKAVYVKCW